MAISAMTTNHAGETRTGSTIFVRGFKAMLLAAAACGAGVVTTAPAHAQTAADNVDPNEIIVTARRRAESILNVPVIETAITQQQIERLQTNNVKDLAQKVPGLLAGGAPASSGLQVSIRGIGSAINDPAVDQAVALFVDGQQFSQGQAYAAASFDTAQFEVLKGPQSLFFGKGAPAGVISIRTIDPTNKFEVIGRAGYEFEARNKRGELIVSGPISETLKARIAGMYEQPDGYYKNTQAAVPAFGTITPKYSRVGHAKSLVLRGTLLWDPIDTFHARVKVTGYKNKTYEASAGQAASCPDGTGGIAPFNFQFMAGDDCKLNRSMPLYAFSPAFFPGVPNDGYPFLKVGFRSGVLDMNWNPVETLTVTSVSSYYRQRTTSFFAGSPTLAVLNTFNRTDLTQEVRVNSDFSGRLNFTGGAYIQDGRYTASQDLPATQALRNTFLPGAPPLFPAKLTKGFNNVDILSASLFGQLRFQVTDQIELAGGTRYTDENRHVNQYNQLVPAGAVLGTGIYQTIGQGPGNATFIPLARNRIRSKRFSPEATITFKPSPDVTIFAAAKQAYKSGGFNAGSIPAPGSNIDFGDERTRGFEGGLKTRLLDRRLTFEVAAYRYTYTGLQIGTTQNTANGVPVALTVNAGKARVYGLDVSTSYRPDIEGLSFYLNGQYNKGKFLALNNIPCYEGQMVSEGCNQQRAANGLFTAQDLSGSDLVRGPRWQITGGGDYEMPVGNGMTVTLTNATSYVSRFLTTPGNRADFYQKGYIKFDLSASLRGKDDRWEIALIGKNVTKEITAGNCSPANLQASLLGGTVTGGTTRGPAGIAEVTCRPDPGREIYLRLTVRPFG